MQAFRRFLWTSDRKNLEVKKFEPHEVKSAASVRRIPLVGVALKVFQRFLEGFPRYMDKKAQPPKPSTPTWKTIVFRPPPNTLSMACGMPSKTG